MMILRRFLSFFVIALMAVSLAACGSGDKGKEGGGKVAAGKRVSVLDQSRKITADSSLTDFLLQLPEPAVNTDWAQNGGNAQHAMGHVAYGSTVPKKKWSADIGSGSSGYYKLLSNPVINGNRLYAQDSIGRVSAYDLSSGDRLWRVETEPTKASDEAIGGGVAVENGVVYATTGFGEVLALRAADGALMWRRMLGKPIRSAPTVAESRVYVINIENETVALNAKDGMVMWQHKGIAESATLMGSSSPAVKGDTVVVAYSSGEVFGLRAQNGRVVWSEVLAVPTKIGALPAIADIRGLPVMADGSVFSVSHSGRMAAIDERRGERRWDADIGGVNTPLVAGNVVYVVSNDGDLVALSRADGRVVWVTALQRLENPSNRESKPVTWSGPVLAGGRLWLVNSLGILAAYAPDTGREVWQDDLDETFYLPPIVANQTMYLLTDGGKVMALR